MRIELLNRINSDKTFQVNPLGINRILKNKPDVLTLMLPVNGNEKSFELTKSRIFSDDFVVKNEFGEILNLEMGAHYRGKVMGNPNSVVVLTFTNDEIYGLVHDHEGAFDLKKIDNENHIFTEIQSNNDFSCSSLDEEIDNQIPTTYSTNTTPQQLPLGLNPYVTTVANYCLRAFWEVDFDIYSLHTGNTVSYVTSLFNASATLFENDGIYVVLSEMKVWTTGYATFRNNVPVNSTDCGDVLNAFRGYYNQNLIPINGDFGHYLTYNFPIDGDVSNGGRCGVSSLNGPCRTNVSNPIGLMFCMSQLYYTNTLGSSTVYTWNINVITHEQGHQFGSLHTHACAWNGNNTAIDSCAETEGSCPNIGYPPPGGGTIMSYCHQVGGIGINFANGFGPQPQQVIVNSINAKTCLQSCGPAPTPNPTATPTKTFGLTQTPTVTNTLTRTVTTTKQWDCRFSQKIIPPYTGGTRFVSGVTFSSTYNSNTTLEVSFSNNCISNIAGGTIFGPELGHNALPFSYTLISDTPLTSIALRFGNVRPYMSINITTNSGIPILNYCNGCCVGITGNTIYWEGCNFSPTRYGAVILVDSNTPFTNLIITGTNPFPSDYGIIFDFINFSIANETITPTPTPTFTQTPTQTSTLPTTPTQTPTITKTSTLTKTPNLSQTPTKTKTPLTTLTPTISANACNPYACSNPIRTPMTVNGIFITENVVGSIYNMPAQYSSCNGSVITPANIYGLGNLNPFTYTLNFSSPISSIVMYITAAGLVNTACTETFTVITNAGNPLVTSPINCFTTIVDNIITMDTNGSPQNGAAGGIFLISSIIPFTSVSVSGLRACAGAYIVFCADSLICPEPLPLPTPTPTVTLPDCCSRFTMSSSLQGGITGSTFLITTCSGTTLTQFVPLGQESFICAKQVTVLGNEGIVVRAPGCICECYGNLPIIGQSVNLNGVSISGTGTGYATSINPYIFFNYQCSNLFTWENSVILGYNQNLNPTNGSFVYTLIFSQFVNNIRIVLGGSVIGESFTFISNQGQVTITNVNSCGYDINQNIISSNFLTNESIGEFIISSPIAFYTLTISGPGGGNGTIISVNKCSLGLDCDLQYYINPGITQTPTSTSILVTTPTTTPTNTNTMTLTKTNTQTKTLTPTVTKTPTVTPTTGISIKTIFINFNSRPFN